MRKGTRSPSLAKDLGMLAGLYRNVFWMMGHRQNAPIVRYEPDDGSQALRENERDKEPAVRS